MTTERDLIQRLADALHDAAEDVEGWGNYASIYFQEKHDLSGNVAKIHALAKEARAFLSQPETEELTDEEIADEARKYLVNEYALPAEITYLLDSENFEYEPTIGCFRAVIAADRARWGK